MGRSVMTHPKALVTAYVSWEEHHTSLCQYCDEEVKRTYDGWVLEYDNDNADTGYCSAHAAELASRYGTPEADITAEATHEGYDYDSDNFQNDLEATIEGLKYYWPSLYEAERWPYREVHVVLENSLVEVSISEYCGLVALCIAPRTNEYGELVEWEKVGLAKHWAHQISERFERVFGGYYKIGTFSNGESVYEARG